MAHFARVNSEGIVSHVIVVSNEDMLDENGEESEAAGIAFLDNLYPDETDTWIQTSYNTRSGKHQYDGSALRGNFCGIGYIYDSEKDVFYQPSPYPSWVLNNETFQWEAPIAYELGCTWDEDNQVWQKPEKPAENPSFIWHSDFGIWGPPVPINVENQPIGTMTYIWDEDTVAWVKPNQPAPSWAWNDSGWWEAPTSYPDATKPFDWDESTLSWIEVVL